MIKLLKSLRLSLIIFIPFIITILFYIYDVLKYPRAEINLKLTVMSSPEMVLSPYLVISTRKPEEVRRSGQIRDKRTEVPRVKELVHRIRDDSGVLNYLETLKGMFLKEQRELIALEMKGYSFKETGGSKNNTFENLLTENNGEPIRNVIFATWRSGSTFIGDLLNSHPATFYHYEPLLHLGVKQLRSIQESEKALKILSQLLYCNYTDIDDFNLSKQQIHQERNRHNNRLWRFCQKRSMNLCEDPNFLSSMCKLFPFQSMKTVRSRLSLGKALLEIKRLNIRLLLLVRDPRGIMNSRGHRDWCFRGRDCIQTELLCGDMEEDFKYAEELREKYPHRFLSLRYEDISFHPFQAAKKIFHFFHLSSHPNVNYFLQTHTVTNHGGITSTYRDSSKTPFHWIKEFLEKENFVTLETIQSSCSKVMHSWGYLPVSNQSELASVNPLGRPPWMEMLINL